MEPVEIDPYKNSDKELDFIGIAFFPEFNLSVYSRCLSNFPQFEKDFEALWRNKIITEAKNKFKWNYSLTSLGQYFRNLDAQWNDYSILEMVETEFDIPRHKLKHLINANGREPDFIREKAIDYEKLMEILEPHRKQVEEQEREQEKEREKERAENYSASYNAIKDYVLNRKEPQNRAELIDFVEDLIQELINVHRFLGDTWF